MVRKYFAISLMAITAVSSGSVSAADQLHFTPIDAITTEVALDLSEGVMAGTDIFSGELVLAEDILRHKAGGTATSIDLGNVGVNVSTTTGTVENNSADGSVTGTIADNVIGQNSGFTTVFINSGNNVLFQNTLQVNIFTGTD